ncbi:DUF859 family phage minor structural protein [Dubosiella newyorkensis]|jgi:hypothetical protein|uniref:DUF859 family phage minor structural protein n=2 Tax=Dubosiella newyorkensis TaxID=1862672 RepID=UPI0023558E9D|nr:DUF859 family phage minor structural protein [Dubosiella newyorkensis]MCI9042246.1 hypothetical protein [Dubosiella newyorkensis]
MAYGNWHGAVWRHVWSNNVYSIYVQWDWCQDIEANKTKISMMGVRIHRNNTAYSFYNAYGKVGVGDFSGNKYETTVAMDLRNTNEQTYDVTDRHSEITHNADGTWPTGKVCGWWMCKAGVSAYNSPEVGWTAFNIDGSIPAIPRATNPTLSKDSVDMGTAVTINLPKATSSFTHDIFYKYSKDSSYTTLVNGDTGTSKSWTPPTSLAAKIPNASSGEWNILVRTKSGNTIIGDKVINITLNVPANIVPSVSSVSVVEATAGIAAQFAKFVQGRSKFKVTVTAAGASGSTIKSYSISVDGKSYSGNSNVFTTQVINGSGSLNLVASVTDSRGRSASKTVTVAVSAYSAPSVKTFSVVRCNSNGVENEEGTAVKILYEFAIAAMDNKNSRSFKIQQLNGSNWVDIQTISDAYTQNSSVIKTGPFSVDSKFSFRAIAADYFTSATVYADVAPSFSLINFGKDGRSIAFGGVSANDGRFENYLPMYSRLQNRRGNWLSGATPQSSSIYLAENSNASFTTILGLKTINNHAFCLGAINDWFGIFGYKSGRTANGYDMSMYKDASNGNLYNNGNMVLDVSNYPTGTRRWHYRMTYSCGKAKWVHIGNFSGTVDSSNCYVKIYSGSGYNGNSVQNSIIHIQIKDGWQNPYSATKAFGVTWWYEGCQYHNGIQVKALASAHNAYQLWVYFPWDYSEGDVEVYTEYTFQKVIAAQDGAPTSGTAQEVKNITPDMRGHPVGSIFRCNNGSITNPANIMGGTWQECRVAIANSQNTGYVVDNAGNIIANSNNLAIYTYNGSTSQLWYLQSVQKNNGTRHDVREWIRTQ